MDRVSKMMCANSKRSGADCARHLCHLYFWDVEQQVLNK